jgi:uncharacterized protein (DUF427 family)
MWKAVWNEAVVAESAETKLVEGNRYFPPAAIHRHFFRESQTHTTCFWKGEASYYDLIVDGQINRDAAWYYPATQASAKVIEGHIAFWRGVQVFKE